MLRTVQRSGPVQSPGQLDVSGEMCELVENRLASGVDSDPHVTLDGP